MEKLQQTAFDLLDLSYGEEKVVDALSGGIRGQQMRPVAREHARVTRSATRLSEELHDLAQKNFMISERLLSEMRNLVELLEEGVEELRLSRARRSRDTAIEGMAAMNRIVINLLTAARNAQGSGGGSGRYFREASITSIASRFSCFSSRVSGFKSSCFSVLFSDLSMCDKVSLSISP